MNAHDPNFGLLILFSAIFVYGLAPAFFPAVAILGMLWLLGSHPILALLLVAIWLLRWLIREFFIALAAGFGAGLGAKWSGVLKGRRQR